MLKTTVVTNNAPITLAVKIRVDKPTKVHLEVVDHSLPERKFTNRYKTIKGSETLYVRMPLSPKVAEVVVYEAIGGLGRKSKSVQIESVKKVGLERRFSPQDIGNRKIRSFVDFAQRFVFNVYKLQANETYKSDDGNYFIQLKEQIVSSNGKVMTTPARIGRTTGIIQVSKKDFVSFTVPMSFAILMHEFSHFYLNEKIDDEMEADLNGLLLYLGLGYPRIEAYQAFLETFKKAPTSLNKSRYDGIHKFITEFEDMNLIVQ